MLASAVRTLGATTGQSGWQPDSKRGNRHERGYGFAWERLRQTIMGRDSFLCQPCKRNGYVTAAKQVDHITPKAQGGTDEPSNLEAICVRCHKAKTARESNG